MPDPLDMRAAVATYVEQVHRAYLAQADTFPPAVRGRMALLTGGPLTVVAAGARNLHLIGTQLLARAIAPRDATVAELADSPDPDPDPDAVRKALLAHVGGRTEPDERPARATGTGARVGSARDPERP